MGALGDKRKEARMAPSSSIHRPLRSNRRTYYLLRDGSVSKNAAPPYLLRIRAESLSIATLMALALETKFRRESIRLASEEV